MKLSKSLVLVSFAAMLGCEPTKIATPSKEKPAKVEAYPNEADVYRVILTPMAEERLRVRTVNVEKQSVPRTRMLGGQILVPDGQRIPVTAPLAGKLVASQASPLPQPGSSVTLNQPLFGIDPILRPDLEVPGAAERAQMANARAMLISAQIQADGDAQQAKAQVDGAKIAFERAKKLLADRAGSQRAVDDTEAAWNVATEAYEAASQRKALLEKLTLDMDAGKAPIVPITAPTRGTVQTVMAQVGQVVNVGAPLLEIVDLTKLWVRVPIYAGQLHEIDLQLSASMTDLSQQSEPESLLPTIAPPTADPLAASIDLYYELNNAMAKYHPGERVSVYVPMKGSTDTTVVPRASILRDIHGIAWVYIRTAEREYRRKRVNIEFTTKELAVLASGPAVGAEVVVDGAAELFGTEFGTGK